MSSARVRTDPAFAGVPNDRPAATFAWLGLGVAVGFVLGVAALVLATPRILPVAGLRPQVCAPILPAGQAAVRASAPPPLAEAFRAHAFEIAVGLIIGLIAIGVTVYLFGRSG